MYNQYTESRTESKFINNTLLYMGMALFLTFITAYAVTQVPAVINLVFGNPPILYVSIGLELVLVIAMNKVAHKVSKTTLITMFIAYSVLNGITFSYIFLRYDLGLVFGTFFITSGMFFSSAMIGMTIKKDLSIVGRAAMMGLMGLIFMGIASIFIPGLAGNFMFNLAGVAIFVALTAYDMQKIKRIHQQGEMFSSTEYGKLQILAALTLYLDFINMFLYLIRLLGRKK